MLILMLKQVNDKETLEYLFSGRACSVNSKDYIQELYMFQVVAYSMSNLINLFLCIYF